MSELDRAKGDNILDVLEKQHKELLAIHGTIGATIGALKQQQHQIDDHHHQIADLRREVGIQANHYTVQAWVTWHGHRMSEDAARDEGMRLHLICRERGIAVPTVKVCNGGRFAVRNWPLDAIRIWWPDCCVRYGWSETWNRR